MDKEKISKLKTYVSENRPQKLRAYTRKHKVKLPEVLVNKRRNLLHYCCKHGSGVVMRFLIAQDVSGVAVDKDLCTPLHLALQRGLNSEDDGYQEATTECYSQMILPLIQAFPECMDMKNTAGISCRQLLHQLVQKRKLVDSDDDQFEHGIDGDFPPSMDETAWRDKLADECQFEYNTTWGRYEPDFTSYSTQNETYDDWADRIREEYYARKRTQSAYQSSQGTQKRKRKHSGEKTKEKEKLENARAKMRDRFEKHAAVDREMHILKQRIKYEERYRKTLRTDNKDLLKFEDVPWPSENGHRFDIEVLFEGMDKSGPEYKKYLRDQQIRWHPDKFMQRFGHILNEREKDRILRRVTELSQTLNKLVT